MLQELTSANAAAWATASMLFFVAVYAIVAVRVFRTPSEDLDARARLALDDAAPCDAPRPLDTAAHG